MSKVRTYKVNLERSRGSMTGTEIRAVKCAKKREKHRAIHEYNLAVMEYKQEHPVNPATQLRNLDFRLGVNVGAKRERKRLESRLYTAA